MNLDKVRILLRRLHLKIGFRAVLGSILSSGLLFAVGTMFLFAWLAEEMLEGETQRFDETIRSFVHSFASEPLTSLMRVFTILGSTIFLTAMASCVLAISLYKSWKRVAALVATTMAGAVILDLALKTSFGRARPIPFFDTPTPASYSFPSGHALFSFCFYGALAWLIAARLQTQALQIAIWAVAVILVSGIGISRIYLGVHYPSDVLAGYAAAFVWLFSIVMADSIWTTLQRSSK